MNKVFTLMVSSNCGITYYPDCTANNPEDLLDRCHELDDEGLRWAIDDEEGRPQTEYVCAIFKGIFNILGVS